MLTQGYRRFEWRQVLDNKYSHFDYEPKKGLEITGLVTKSNGSPIANEGVILIPSDSGPVLNTISDKKGAFHFSNLIFFDTTHFVLSTVNAKGRNSAQLIFNTGKDEPVVTPNNHPDLQIERKNDIAIYIENFKNFKNEQIKYGTGKTIVLKEVKVKRYKNDDQYETQSLAGAGHADQVMHAEEIEKISGPLTTSLSGRLHGVSFFHGVPYLQMNNTPFGIAPMLVILDGVEITKQGDEQFNIDEIPSSQVETVEVLKFASASIYGMSGGNGVLIITTKRGGQSNAGGQVASPGILPIAPIGFYKAREFYSPKYNYTNLKSKQADLRSTIYWNPEIKLNENGNASFDYYNADGMGTYRVVIEGIDNNGNLGRLVYRYKVQ